MFRIINSARDRLAPDNLKKQLQDNGERVLRNLEDLIDRNSLCEGGPFYDTDAFPWIAKLESHWEEIRDELHEVLDEREKIPYFHKIQEDQTRIAGDEKWRTYFLYGYGYKSLRNCEQAPRTTELIEQIPGMTTAMFSILAPGKEIPPHRGPYKGVLRYHLGLQVPEKNENCRIRVDDEWRHWEEGKSILFDDTLEHEVKNDTDEERVVLFLDVLRPMPMMWDRINRSVLRAIALSPYVRDAMDKQEEWERDHYGYTHGTETTSIWNA